MHMQRAGDNCIVIPSFCAQVPYNVYNFGFPGDSWLLQNINKLKISNCEVKVGLIKKPSFG